MKEIKNKTLPFDFTFSLLSILFLGTIGTPVSISLRQCFLSVFEIFLCSLRFFLEFLFFCLFWSVSFMLEVPLPILFKREVLKR